MPAAGIIDDARVEALEAALDALNAGLPPLREFILPGGGSGAGAAHVARAVCRRAERGLVALARDEPGERGEPPVRQPSVGLPVRRGACPCPRRIGRGLLEA